MARKRNIKSHADFVFVNEPRFNSRGVNMKLRSTDARSHAAYWSGPIGTRRRQSQRAVGADLSASFTSQRQKSSESDYAYAAQLLLEYARLPSPQLLNYEIFQYLPPLPGELKELASHMSQPVFDFCGQSFVEKFLMHNHEDYYIMFSGIVLLTSAQNMILHGKGSMALLLRLKQYLYRHVRSKIESNNSLSLWCWTAVLALGSPAVSLISQELPEMFFQEYYNKMLLGTHTCCSVWLRSYAERAMTEVKVHRHAIRVSALKNEPDPNDERGNALFKYMHGFYNISIAIQAAYHLESPLEAMDKLFPVTTSCNHCSIPPEWASMLTCQWPSRNPSPNGVEQLVHVLVGLAHEWFATFLDGDCHVLEPTEKLLDRRASLRKHIENFGPLPEDRNSEAVQIYECSRSAINILLTVEKLKVSFNSAVLQSVESPSPVHRIRWTNHAKLWGEYRGLLFLTVALNHFAFAGRCFSFFCEGVMIRCAQEIAMTDWTDEIAIKPLKRLKTFESLCISSWNQVTEDPIMAI